MTINPYNSINHYHCIGVGGIGLSAIAEILLVKGHKVTGSDIKESDTTKRLEDLGIGLYIGHESKNIDHCDAVVYTAAVSEDNPELLAAKKKNIPTFSRAEMLGLIMQDYPFSIAVSGAHGKTTTTSMISLILEASSLDPTILVGGNLNKIGGNVKVGKKPYLVTEACEYVDSFLKLNPKIEVILNIDSDHLDYFKDIDHIVRSFQKFASRVPEDGLIIAYNSNAFVKTIIENVHCKVITFGLDNSSDYYASNIKFNTNGFPEFDVYYCHEYLGHIHLSVPGEHNVNNSLAAIACCHQLNISMDNISETLHTFEGTKRRFDVMGVTQDNKKIIDDYAHHPEEIKATLKACKNVSHDNLWCIFQPHTYTRTKALFDEFAHAFDLADNIILTDIYAAREKNIYQVKSSDLVQSIKENYPDKNVFYIQDFEDITDFVIQKSQPDDLIITMGAGNIYKVGEMIVEKLENEEKREQRKEKVSR